MTDMQAEFGIDNPGRPLVYLIVGPGESGKDTAADELQRLSRLPAQSTSVAFFEGRGITRNEFAERTGADWRMVLAGWMAGYMVSDGSGCRLYKQMYGGGVRIFSGIRRLVELIAFVHWLIDRADVRVWWIDASERDLPPDSSLDFGLPELRCLDVWELRFLDTPVTVIDSNAGVPELQAEVRRVWENSE